WETANSQIFFTANCDRTKIGRCGHRIRAKRATADGQERTVYLSPHSRPSWQIIAVFRLAPTIPISGFLIFVLPVANIAPRSQIRRAFPIEVWMLEIAVIR
ncbi:MAG: hypothetical protein WC100_22715, partial [Sterolibacterium sp.]